MAFLYRTIHRITEDEMARNESFRRKMEELGRPMLSGLRAMSDEAIVEKLASIGVEIDRERLEEMTRNAPSAQAAAERIYAELPAEPTDFDDDWIWMGLVCLWERWFPDRLNLETIDDLMSEEYKALESGDDENAVLLGERTWEAVVSVIDRTGVTDVFAFDELFSGTYSFIDWLWDYEELLDKLGYHGQPHCRRHLAAYKVPRAVQFVESVPITSSGKIMRRLLTDIDDGRVVLDEATVTRAG